MIYLGSDHGGFELKEKIKGSLTALGYEYEDLGNTIYDKDDDYPLFAKLVAEKVVQDEQSGKKSYGILACRSAQGMVIASNKIKGTRAVWAVDQQSAKHAREHNNANIVTLSGDWLEESSAEMIIKVFLTTEFSGEERHRRRLRQIEEMEAK